ncbi:unnamed protein product [Polarella glacialis]|uniref:Uncharacterized protein n=1 Tax=Polarella glacialis TaxID=89957 RepID=A0A813EI90_POLGL|nr:unnamed protein product [Polarella glacialis]
MERVLILAPFERGVGSKAGIFDETLLLDDVRAPYLGPLLGQLVDERLLECKVSEEEGALLWDFSAKEFLAEWRAAVEFLGLPDEVKSPYQNRHGGASRDHLCKLRSVEDVKRRGRWAADASARIYDKPGRLQQLLNKTNVSLTEYAAELRKRFVRYYLSNSAPQPPKN